MPPNARNTLTDALISARPEDLSQAKASQAVVSVEQETRGLMSSVRAAKPEGFVVAIQSLTAKATTPKAQCMIDKYGIPRIARDIAARIGNKQPIFLVSQGDRRKDKGEDPALPGRGVGETLAGVARTLHAMGFNVHLYGVTEKGPDALESIFPEVACTGTIHFSPLSKQAVQAFYPNLPEKKCKYASAQIAANIMADAVYVVHTPSARRETLGLDCLSGHTALPAKHVLFIKQNEDHAELADEEECNAAQLTDTPALGSQ